MYERSSQKYKKTIKIIHPGELYASGNDELIGTVLGSCVAVCLFDEGKGIAGMNHFMLPGRISSRDVFSDVSARYGITAINTLIGEMERLGVEKKDLVAKIFGGGHVLASAGDIATIPADNIRIAHIMMEMEDIPIVKSDVGEHFTRKLLMDTKNGRVYLKKTVKDDVFQSIEKRDSEFAKRRFHRGNN